MDRTEVIIASPIGCLFTLLVAEHRYPIAEAVAPPLAYLTACAAIEIASPWRGAHDRILEEALERGSRQRDLASRLIEHPSASWWFEPLDREQQLWTGLDELTVLTPTYEPTRSEREALRPTSSTFTSTLRARTSHLTLAMQTSTADWSATLPQRRLALEVNTDARIFEIDGAQAWHQLCRDYPVSDKSSPVPQLSPDWSQVARDWDGVHLSFGGLLASEQTRYQSEAGWSMHRGWAAETTLWLNDVFTNRTPLDYWTAFEGPPGLPGLNWVDELLVQSRDALKWFEHEGTQ